jgi:hypothetical protein
MDIRDTIISTTPAGTYEVFYDADERFVVVAEVSYNEDMDKVTVWDLTFSDDDGNIVTSPVMIKEFEPLIEELVMDNLGRFN